MRIYIKCIIFSRNLHNVHAILGVHGKLICVPTEIGRSSIGIDRTKHAESVGEYLQKNT